MKKQVTARQGKRVVTTQGTPQGKRVVITQGGRRKAQRVQDMRRVLLRLPDDLAEWVDDTAAEFRLSRDAFVRQLLTASREGFKAAAVEGTEESALFRRMENRLAEATERAVKEAVDEAIRRAGGVTRSVVAPSSVE